MEKARAEEVQRKKDRFLKKQHVFYSSLLQICGAPLISLQFQWGMCHFPLLVGQFLVMFSNGGYDILELSYFVPFSCLG